VKLITIHLSKYLFYTILTGILLAGGANAWVVVYLGGVIVMLFDFWSLE